MTNTYDKCLDAKKILEEKGRETDMELLNAILEKDFDKVVRLISLSRNITQAHLKIDVMGNIASEQSIRARIKEQRDKKELLDMVCPK